VSRAAANAPMTTRVNSSRHALKSRAPDSPLFNRRPLASPHEPCRRLPRNFVPAYPTIPRPDDNKDAMIRAIALSKKARNERRFRTYSGR